MKNIQEKITSKEKQNLKLLLNLFTKLILIAMLVLALTACFLKTAHWELLIMFCLVIYLIDQMVARFCRQLNNYSSYHSLSVTKAALKFKTVTWILAFIGLSTIYFLTDSFRYSETRLTIQLSLMCCALGLITSSLFVRTSSAFTNRINFTI